MEYAGIYGMFVLAALLLANGLRLLVFCGYSRSFLQVAAVAVVILLVFGAPLVIAALVPWGGAVAYWASVTGGVIFLLFLLFCLLTIVLGRKSVVKPWEYVFVLGAGLKKGRTPSLTLSSRLDSALAFLRENEQGVAVLCGGKGSDELVAESAAMREYLIGRGFSGGRIIEDAHSSTTYENLLFGMTEVQKSRLSEGEFVQFHAALKREFSGAFGLSRLRRVRDFNEKLGSLPSVVVVTSDFHSFRTLLTAKFVPGMKVVGVVGKPSKLYYLPLGLARDFVSLAVHIVRIALGRER